MRLAERLAREAAHPRGWLARPLYAWMRLGTAAENRAALERLGLAPDARLLELGFGHGRTLARALRRLPEGGVVGVDPSALMLRRAARRHRAALRAGRLRLQRGTAEALPLADASVDAAIAVHVLYFWHSPERALSEIHRVLRPGGRLVLGFRAQDEHADPRRYPPGLFRMRSRAELGALLREAGFEEVRVRALRLPLRTVSLAEARRPARAGR